MARLRNTAVPVPGEIKEAKVSVYDGLIALHKTSFIHDFQHQTGNIATTILK